MGFFLFLLQRIYKDIKINEFMLCGWVDRERRVKNARKIHPDHTV